MKKNIKNIYRGGLLIALAGTMVSCGDDFLKQDPLSSMSQVLPIVLRQVCRLP